MYRSEYIVCFRSEISFVPLLSSHRTPFLRPYWQIYFNSTSNHNVYLHAPRRNFVVSYFNSTSNHNWILEFGSRTEVVSYFNSTSNHNCLLFVFGSEKLFLISILHQTTTMGFLVKYHPRLFLISILHQTTTSDMRFVDCHSVMWPNERYERRMTGRGSRNDAGFVFQRYFSLKVECTSRARNRYMFAK